jgi:hypothetical protein
VLTRYFAVHESGYGPYTVATLPSSPAIGEMAYVTDAASGLSCGATTDKKVEQVPTRELVSRADLETFVHLGDQISHYEAVETRYAIKMPQSIEQHARLIDEKMADITVCDPAVGSGAFPVGMMTEIVRARSALTPYFNDYHDRTPYQFKRHAIQNCLYGVDIDPGAVEIAKLRLWLSLVVDEEEVKQIKPLPNLDYKVVVGNSLLDVETTLLNQEQFRKLERLKPEYFDATNPERKNKLKRQIDELIHHLTNDKTIFDFEIYFSEVFYKYNGFDVVLGNPPYVGQSGNKEMFREVLKTDLGKRYHQRRMDYFYFFFHKALLIASDLPLNFHPAAIRVSAVDTPFGAV